MAYVCSSKLVGSCLRSWNDRFKAVDSSKMSDDASTINLVTIYEGRCSNGEVCGKNNRLLYKKKSREEVVECLTWHFFEKHQEQFNKDWELCKEAAENADCHSAYDVEVEESDGKGKGKDKGGKDGNGRGGKGKSKNREKDRQRDRSRRRDRDRDRSRSRETRIVLTNPGTAARGDSVNISRVELDEIIDSIQRSIHSTQNLSQLCQRLARNYDDECAALTAVRHSLERHRRA